jgi:hypothetical protein
MMLIVTRDRLRCRRRKRHHDLRCAEPDTDRKPSANVLKQVERSPIASMT